MAPSTKKKKTVERAKPATASAGVALAAGGALPKPGAVRAFLLQSAELPSWTSAYAATALGIELKDAVGVLAALAMVGYIEPDPDNPKSNWRNTEAGNTVAGVSKAKPVTRKTVERSLEELLARIRAVNMEKQFLYSVEKAAVFGPYLNNDVAKIKNVDVAIALQPKLSNEKKLHEAVKADAARAEAEEGKRFKSFADRRSWGQNKVRKHLKGNARAIALHDLNETILSQPHKIVFER